MDLKTYYLQQMGIELWTKRVNPVSQNAIKYNPVVVVLGTLQDEDVTGKVDSDSIVNSKGNSDALLQKMLSSIGLLESQTSIIHLPMENNQSTNYIQEQLKLSAPKLVLALGTSACQCLLEKTQAFSTSRGQWHQYERIPLLLSYHPLALMKNPLYKKKAYQDLLTFQSKLSEFA